VVFSLFNLITFLLALVFLLFNKHRPKKCLPRKKGRLFLAFLFDEKRLPVLWGEEARFLS
jgi:hypothetical protein